MNPAHFPVKEKTQLNLTGTQSVLVADGRIYVSSIGKTDFVILRQSGCTYEQFCNAPDFVLFEGRRYEKRSWCWNGPMYADENDEARPTLDKLYEQISTWTMQQFADQDLRQIMLRVQEEAQEFLDHLEHIADMDPIARGSETVRTALMSEWADIVHCMFDACAKMRADPTTYLAAKFEANLERVWPLNTPYTDSQIRHVKPTDRYSLTTWARMFDVPELPKLCQHVNWRIESYTCSVVEFADLIKDLPATDIGDYMKQVLPKLARPPFTGVQ